MQAEAGQPLEEIVQRKEAERAASDGIFFWGVGNAPNRQIRELALRQICVPVIFSVMKSLPKRHDIDPSGLLVWRRYIDHLGVVHRLPDASLVVSRAKAGRLRSHYALVCKSLEAISLGDHGPFDHRAYRNMGMTGGKLAASQVTALALKNTEFGATCDYRANMIAELVNGYWVRLLDPLLLTGERQRDVLEDLSSLNPNSSGWTALVRKVRMNGLMPPNPLEPLQHYLFA